MGHGRQATAVLLVQGTLVCSNGIIPTAQFNGTLLDRAKTPLPRELYYGGHCDIFQNPRVVEWLGCGVSRD